MRSRLGKAVRKEFESRLKRAVPEFVLVSGDEVPSGCRLFRWQIAPNVTVFLFLQPSPYTQDSFTVEGAWSLDGTYPIEEFPGNPVDLPEHGIQRDEPKEGSFRFRLGKLWTNQDVWWELVPSPSLDELDRQLERLSRGIIEDPPIEEALAKVKPLVEDAVGRVVSYAVPYFLSIAKRYRDTT
jgi:hypothetical protein